MKKIPLPFRTLRHRLLLSIYLVLFTVIIISSALAIWLQYRADKSRITELYERFTQTACRDMEYLLQDVLDIGNYFAVNTEIERVLNAPETERHDSTLFWREETPLDFLQDILAIKSHIKNVILYPENGQATFYISRDASVFDTDIERIRETESYKDAIGARGSVIWDKVGRGSDEPFTHNMSDKIVAYRELFDLSKRKRLGFLAIGIEASSFEAICRQMMQYPDEAAIVLDSTGQEFLTVGELSDEVKEEILRQGFESIAASAVPELIRFDGYYIFASKSDKTGITVCYVSPENDWRRILQTGSLAVPIILLVSLMIIFLPLSALMSMSLTRPVENLSRSMEKFQEGDFSQQVEVMGDDEIGQLSRTFNRMVTELRELVDKNYVMTLREKEMELNTLQSQINPHFLYNVLDSLYWQATDEGNEKLAEDILTLSKLFRMVLSEGRSEISVEWEVELVTCYLQIQKMRFARRLSYEIDVDEGIMHHRISKLMLQPFVENAVVHGLEMQKEGGEVRLHGYREKDRLIFVISDNGIGMEQTEADRILTDTGQSESIGHYAIRNVRDRLSLKYGEEYELKIESEPGMGTTVRIAIPAETRTGEGTATNG